MKKLTQNIPKTRLLIYLALLACLPLFWVSFSYIKKRTAWNEVTQRIIAVHAHSEKKTRKQSLNATVRKKYSDADYFYLDHQVESLTFLKKEREALENLLNNPSFTGNEAAERRYVFLLGEGNHIQFSEGSVQSGEGFQERTEALIHSVEVDTQDIRELLARIEGNRPGKPQLLITDFKLNKKLQTNGNQVFELNLKLLKREFTQ